MKEKEIRGKIINKLKEIFSGTKMTEKKIISIEKSIKNYSVLQGNSKGISCKWDNKSFLRIYSDKARQLLMNLDRNCDSIKNKGLYKKVISGKINTKDLVGLTPEELYPAHWKKLRQEFNEKETVLETFKPKFSTEFKCGKCKQKKTTHYSVQTRSSDEPSTIFVECVNCGNRWTM